MTIHIYGDSFAETFDKAKSWSDFLSEIRNEEYLCTAQSGTAPNYILEKFIDDLQDNKFKDNDNLIILLSDTKRLNFPFLDHPEKACGALNEKKFEYEMMFVVKTLGPMFLFENLKNVLFLKFLADTYKQLNFYVFTCFGLNYFLEKYPFGVKHLDFLDSLNLNIINNSNFRYYDVPLKDMVSPENSTIFLHNHMTLEENKQFGKFLADLLDGKEPEQWFKDLETGYIDGSAFDFIYD